ncbi:phage portal protein [Sodalis sp. RH24]|uniref:phage portal protein n=1 Tax=unclassified Sodalis (in: enterobacteria) TaxID=2636512 RepID=UPI0039B6C3C4
MEQKRKLGKFRTALVNWFGLPIGLTTGEFWQEWNGTSSSGQTVTAQRAMQLSAVWACVKLLSDTISTLPLKVYSRQADGSRKLAQDHPAYKVLCRQPNTEMTPHRFMLMVVASICLRGNAYVEKLMIGSKVVSLVPLLPQGMDVKRLDNGQLQYTYTDIINGKRVIPVDRMMHIRGFGLDGVCGMIPTHTGRDVIGSALAVEESAGKFFKNGLQTSGFITSKDLLKPEQRKQIRDSLQNFRGSDNSWKTMVLEADMGYQSITMNPEAAQMLQTRAYSIEEICRWFRVPPFMVGHADKQSSWASSVDGMNMQFLTHTLTPLLVNIEQEISRCMLNHDEDYYAEFSVEGLLRADSAGRAAYYTSALQNGWMSRNDVRRLENMPPIDGGDIYTVQLNLTPLDQLGKEPTTNGEQARAAMESWLFPERHSSPQNQGSNIA